MPEWTDKQPTNQPTKQASKQASKQQNKQTTKHTHTQTPTKKIHKKQTHKQTNETNELKCRSLHTYTYIHACMHTYIHTHCVAYRNPRGIVLQTTRSTPDPAAADCWPAKATVAAYRQTSETISGTLHSNISICVFTCVYVCMQVCRHAGMHVRTRVGMHVWIRALQPSAEVKNCRHRALAS